MTVEDLPLGTGEEWYVIVRPNQDPARVVAGPMLSDSAKASARFHPLRAKAMHVAPLVYSVREHGYNVQWDENADRPIDLQDESPEHSPEN